jgi:hypothetical protein
VRPTIRECPIFGLERPAARSSQSLYLADCITFTGAPHDGPYFCALHTVGRYLPRRPKTPSPTWRSFLHNHLADTAAIDMFIVATATFRILYTLLQWYWKGDFVKDLPDAAIEAHLVEFCAAKLRPSPPPVVSVSLKAGVLKSWNCTAPYGVTANARQHGVTVAAFELRAVALADKACGQRVAQRRAVGREPEKDSAPGVLVVTDGKPCASFQVKAARPRRSPASRPY